MNLNHTVVASIILGIGASVLLTSAFLPETSIVEKYDAALAPSFTSGPPSSRTGAPGEANCTSCHAGSVMDGSSENIFDMRIQGMSVSAYMPGETYTVHLSLNSQPSRKGFQATVLDGSSDFVGTFTANSADGVQTQSGMGRSYVAHNSTGSGSSIPEWTWEWTAPSSDEGTVTFYVSTNKANNNGGSSGDEIFTSSHSFGSIAGVEEELAIIKDFQVAYAPDNHKVFITLESREAGATSVNMVDMNGRSVHTAFIGATKLGSNKMQLNLPEEMANGQYVVHFFVNNRAASGLINVVR